MQDVWPDWIRVAMAGLRTVKAPVDDSAVSVLEALAAARLLHRGAAALLSASDEEPQPPMPDARAICPTSIVPFLAHIVQRESYHPLIVEFLRLTEQRGWRLPPEWLPKVMDVAVRQKEIIPFVCQVLGPTAAWLAARRPRWKVFATAPEADQATIERPDIRSAVSPRRGTDSLPAPWKHQVLEWADDDRNWHLPSSPLCRALLHGLHPWPDEVLAVLLAAAERAAAQQPYKVPPIWERWLYGAAVRASAEQLLAYGEQAFQRPHAWAERWRRVCDVALFRRRLQAAFSGV
jgi:hypothetical protein